MALTTNLLLRPISGSPPVCPGPRVLRGDEPLLGPFEDVVLLAEQDDLAFRADGVQQLNDALDVVTSGWTVTSSVSSGAESPVVQRCSASAKARNSRTPITKQSGKRRAVLARHVRNRRLADALIWWAFSSLKASPGARACYDRHRAAGNTHHQALRALSNRWVGILHGCLRHRTTYHENTAWGPSDQKIGHAA